MTSAYKSTVDARNGVYQLKTVAELIKTDVGRRVILGSIIGKAKGRFRGKSEIRNFGDMLRRHSAVSLQETNEIYASHDLSLSIATARNTGNLKNPIMIVHLRNFEIPMSGGIQFCEYFPELAECFEEDREIIFYRSEDEMIDKARFYLDPSKQEVRNQIRFNARTRAENEHTWFKRFSKAFDYLGIQAN